MAVSGIFGRMSFIIFIKLGRRNIVTSSPDLDLIFTMLFYGFKFI